MTVPAHTHGSTPAPLVITSDPALVAELQRLAAAAGAGLDLVAEPSAARSRWSLAPVVLVGSDALPSLVAETPGRRDGVHVVSTGQLPDELFRGALAVGAENVVELPAAESWLVETLIDISDGTAGRANVVGVIGGCGGAGATTYAAALAMTAASEPAAASAGSRPVLLVDADQMGPGIEQTIGLDDVEGARWGPLLESTGRLGSRSLLEALPERGRLAVLGWGPGGRLPLEPPVVREVLSAGRRGSALVVVDLPRHIDAVTAEIVRRCDHLVVVTTLSLGAVTAAAQVAAATTPFGPPRLLVARGSASALSPDGVAAVLGIPLAAVMSDQRRLGESVALGLGPVPSRRGPLARAARAVLARVGGPAAAAGAVA